MPSGDLMTKLVDPVFKVVKPSASGFFIWRIIDRELHSVPKDHYGSFFEGDSYIVYSATETTPRGKLEQHIHFWLGAETSNDESAIAAIKTVELDDYLDGYPIQHREVQGYESPRFKSYFKGGIRILKGGAASGLRHVTLDFAARLFKIKGRRVPLVLEQSSVSWEYFNSGDSFILETRNRIFVWIGESSNKMERLQAAKVSQQLRDEGKDRAIIFIDDGKESELQGSDLAEFKAHLPLHQRTVKPPEPDQVDEVMENETRNSLKLYRCSDEDGTLKVIQVKQGPLHQSDIHSQDSWIIDNGINGIWVWIGKKASSEERRQGIIHAQGFVNKKGYPKGTHVTRVIDGAEPTEFKMLFVDWRDSNATIGMGRQHSMSKIAPTITTTFDAATLHKTPGLAADTQLVDDGSGDMTVWRLHGRELELVPSDYWGVFFSGDCYLVHYSYVAGGGTAHILYYWLGAHSSQDERGIIAWHTIQKDDELNGVAVQVRVVEGKEPPHFLTIFKGSMITFNGGYASLFDGKDAKDVGLPSEFLVQVHGGDQYSTKAAQVPLSASSLNSGDVFVLVKEDVCYVWCGKGSTGDERERSKIVASRYSGQNYIVVSEGQEKAEFWELLGGKKPYASDDRLRTAHTKMPARLFHCSNATGVFKAEEIYDFAQSDLVPEDIMVLDVGTAILIWVGSGANRDERLAVGQLVHEYLVSDPRGRDLDTPLIQVQQGYEPPNFTGFFGFWDKDLWKESYETLRNSLESEIVREKVITPLPSSEDVSKYPIKVLTDRDNLPDDVDVRHKEWHLTDEDFEEVFRMPRTEFEKLPKWRQDNYKKAVKLF